MRLPDDEVKAIPATYTIDYVVPEHSTYKEDGDREEEAREKIRAAMGVDGLVPSGEISHEFVFTLKHKIQCFRQAAILPEEEA